MQRTESFCGEAQRCYSSFCPRLLSHDETFSGCLIHLSRIPANWIPDGDFLLADSRFQEFDRAGLCIDLDFSAERNRKSFVDVIR